MLGEGEYNNNKSCSQFILKKKKREKSHMDIIISQYEFIGNTI